MTQALASVVKGSSLRVAFLSLVFSGILLSFVIIGAVVALRIEAFDALTLLTYPLSFITIAVTGKVTQKKVEVNGSAK